MLINDLKTSLQNSGSSKILSKLAQIGSIFLFLNSNSNKTASDLDTYFFSSDFGL